MQHTIEEIRTDYVDDLNLRHVDIYFENREDGETAAVFDQDTGKTIWLKNDWRLDERVSAAVLDMQEEYKKTRAVFADLAAVVALAAEINRLNTSLQEAVSNNRHKIVEALKELTVGGKDIVLQRGVIHDNAWQEAFIVSVGLYVVWNDGGEGHILFWDELEVLPGILEQIITDPAIFDKACEPQGPDFPRLGGGECVHPARKSDKFIAEWIKANEGQIRLEHEMGTIECLFVAFPDVNRKALTDILEETITL